MMVVVVSCVEIWKRNPVGTDVVDLEVVAVAAAAADCQSLS